MREGYEGIAVAGAMFVIAFAVIAIAKWLF